MFRLYFVIYYNFNIIINRKEIKIYKYKITNISMKKSTTNNIDKYW